MSSVGSLTLCIHDLRSPDCRQRDEAARVIWDRFSSRLQALVRRHLDNRIRRREDEQDILQSMYSSFCMGQFEGMTPPASRAELWKLLVRITMCKVVNTAHRHMAARRDVRRESAPPPKHSSGGESMFPQWMLEHVDSASQATKRKSSCSRSSIACFKAFPKSCGRSCSGSSTGSPTPRSPARSDARCAAWSSRCS